MREIKFKFWDKVDKEFVIWPENMYIAGDGKIFTYANLEIDMNEKQIIPIQYTGLKDKNGKEIYEGDIVWSGGHRLHFITEYQLSLAGFMFSSEGLLMGVGQHADVMEIIGNIYENPELLDKEER